MQGTVSGLNPNSLHRQSDILLRQTQNSRKYLLWYTEKGRKDKGTIVGNRGKNQNEPADGLEFSLGFSFFSGY